MGIVLKGGTIATAVDCYQADLRIENEKIVAIGKEIAKDIVKDDDKVLNVDGCYLFPGGIDPHTHFALPVAGTVTADDFTSGTKAAILGGTTTIIDFATQFSGESLTQALGNWHRKADGQCYADYAFHMAISNWNESVASEITSLVEKDGVSSFKLYMAYKGTMQVDDRVLLEALCSSKEAGALICLHCENGDIVDLLVREARARGHLSPNYHPRSRPMLAEREATERAVALAEVIGAPVYIVHLSSQEALRVVADAKWRGVQVYGETCPQYLLLDDTLYEENFNSAKYVISPPLRSKQDQEALWQGLRAGIVDTVATDHCSFNFRGQKELGREDFSKIPNGMPGVENRMGLLYTYGVREGRMTLSQFVNLTSTQAAKLFGLFPRKGTIAVGSDADIVVWEPSETTVITAKEQYQRVDYSPYEGFRQVGRAVQVFLRGQHVVRNGRLNDENPKGIYLSRKPFHP